MATHDFNFTAWLQDLNGITVLGAAAIQLWGEKMFNFKVSLAQHIKTCGVMLGCVNVPGSKNSLSLGEISGEISSPTQFQTNVESLQEIGSLYYSEGVLFLKRKSDGQVIQWFGVLKDKRFWASRLSFGPVSANLAENGLVIE